MRKLYRSLWALVVLAMGCGGEPATAGDLTAFVGVTVLPMTEPGARLRDHTVIVEGDRIVAVGPAAEVAVPRGARRIDGAGRYLMPGLADMHVHLEYFDDPDILKLFVAHGVTTVRNMDGRAYILDWKTAVEDGSLLGPSIHTAGPLLDGSPPVLPDNIVVLGAEEGRAIVHEQVAAGYDFVKVYTALPPDAYRAILETARDLGVPVAGHIPRSVGLEEVLSTGQGAIEHLGDLGRFMESDESPFRNAWHWSKLYAAMPIAPDKLSDVSRILADGQIRVTPTLVQADRALGSGEAVEAWSNAPDVEHLPEGALEAWAGIVRRSTARMDDEDWLIVERGRRNRLEIVRSLHDAGVDVLVGTDTPNPFVIPGSSVAEELENLVEAGFTSAEALMAATRNAAVFLGDSDVWGTIETGRRADLVLLDADPVDDVGHVRRRVGVMIQGRWLPADELQSMLGRLRAR